MTNAAKPFSLKDFQVYEIEFDRITTERVRVQVVAVSPQDARNRAMAGHCLAELPLDVTRIHNDTRHDAPLRCVRPAQPEERPRPISRERLYGLLPAE